MTHEIKYARARKLSATGRLPSTYNALFDQVPAELLHRLTGRELALMIDTLAAVSRTAKAIAISDACDEDGVWDTRRNAFRPLA